EIARRRQCALGRATRCHEARAAGAGAPPRHAPAMTQPTITSAHNQRIKDAVKLRNHRQRLRQQRSLIDGAREILHAAQAGMRFIEVFVCPELCTSDTAQRLVQECRSWAKTIWQVTPDVFEKLAFGKRLDGVVAVIETPERSLTDLALPDHALIAVLS